jgi:tetratricopeptide (TPR) repeat protein
LAFIGLGRICDVANEHQRAVLMHQWAYQLLLVTGDAYLISMAQINWAVNLQRLQQLTQGKEILHDALTLSAAHELPHHVAECQFRLAQIALEEGELGLAESCIEEGLMVIAQTPYHWVEVNLLAEWAKTMARQGLYEQAFEQIKRALLIAQDDRFKQLELQLLRLAQQYTQALGMPQRASEYEHQAQFIRMHLDEERWVFDAASLTALDALLD